MAISPTSDPTKIERNANDLAHTSMELGGHAVVHSLSPEDRAAIEAIKEKALAELAATGNVPAEHMPDPVTLSAENRAEIDAVKADALQTFDQPTT